MCAYRCYIWRVRDTWFYQKCTLLLFDGDNHFAMYDICRHCKVNVRDLKPSAHCSISSKTRIIFTISNLPGWGVNDEPF